LETLRHLTKIKQDTLLAPPILWRSIVLNDLEEEEEEEERREE